MCTRQAEFIQFQNEWTSVWVNAWMLSAKKTLKQNKVHSAPHFQKTVKETSKQKVQKQAGLSISQLRKDQEIILQRCFIVSRAQLVQVCFMSNQVSSTHTFLGRSGSTVNEANKKTRAQVSQHIYTQLLLGLDSYGQMLCCADLIKYLKYFDSWVRQLVILNFLFGFLLHLS